MTRVQSVSLPLPQAAWQATCRPWHRTLAWHAGLTLPRVHVAHNVSTQATYSTVNACSTWLSTQCLRLTMSLPTEHLQAPMLKGFMYLHI